MSELNLWRDPEKQHINHLLFSEVARGKAETIGDAGKADKKKKKNKKTQLRKFYDEFVRLEARTREKNCVWEDVLPFVHMQVAKVTYANGRGLVCNDFKDLIKNGVDGIDNVRDLKVFTQFLEAFIAFYEVYGPRS